MLLRNLLLVLCLCSFHLNVYANEDPIQDYKIAIELANMGYKNHDPLLLIAAAKIIKLMSIRNVSLKKTNEINNKGNKQSKYAVTSILNKAKLYAKGNAELINLIEDIRYFSNKGFVDGPKLHDDDIAANGYDYYKLAFLSNELARVGVVSHDSGQDLDLYIVNFNSQEEIICQDTASSTSSLCEWIPAQEEDFIIKIKNMSDRQASYSLILN